MDTAKPKKEVAFIEIPTRKPNRLKNYDYSTSGAYFITVCVKEKRPLLWRAGAGDSRPQEKAQYLSEYGRLVETEIQKIETIYPGFVTLEKYVIMPNHIHMILLLSDGCAVGGRPKAAPTISRVLQQFKGAVSKRAGVPLWQKSFHDHVIRNGKDYRRIWQYIEENPLKWREDCFYCAADI